MTIRPLGDRILVKRLAMEEKTKAGLIIPDTAKGKSQQGIVVAVGKGKLLEHGNLQPPDVKPGDRVLFGKYAGSDIVIDGEEHLVLREEDILAVIQGDGAIEPS
jgi:chaperonin GroES